MTDLADDPEGLGLARWNAGIVESYDVPPLTDEELAEIKRNTKMWIPVGRDRTLRLIAEVERLREAVSDLKLNGGA